MAWIHILIAGLLETTWAVTLKWSNGFTNFLPTAATTVVTILSFYFLSQALKTLPVGTTYAVLAGIGAIGTVIADIVFFGESYGLLRSFCVGLIVLGVIGLRIL
ncbi:DMT family transporter [aff. Roholtiella sp. LEGE 12411]|uniref:DMT family transporter n=1 Tax=aff. Roholtiella sp. LEGE 12411 TaxID=1828822 RepID=UPI0018803C68|nr:multidrug efflux SMR transporter [aff. Roholtiella sp. LEGE 12411]MBE9038132.1 multidrug efflux SMR transporter [aff. Roholtiella sp. LEGE 12411]